MFKNLQAWLVFGIFLLLVISCRVKHRDRFIIQKSPGQPGGGDLPDLVVSNIISLEVGNCFPIESPAVGAGGGQIGCGPCSILKFTIRNEGKGEAGPFNAKAIFGDAFTIVEIPGLAVDSEIQVTAISPPGVDCSGNRCEVCAVADSNGNLEETKEDNNRLCLKSLIAFVGRGYNENVDVVDLDSMSIITTIVEAGGYRMVLSKDGNKLYSTGGDSFFYVSDARNFQLITAFDPGTQFELNVQELEAIAISPDGKKVYVADEQGDNALFVIDTATDTVMDRAILNDLREPENAVVSPDGAFLYLVDNSVVAKIDTSNLAIVSKVQAGSDAHGVAINLNGNRIYTEGVNGGIDVIDAGSMAAVANIPDAVGYYLEAHGNRLYGVNEGTLLSVMDIASNQLIENVTTSLSNTRGVTASPDGSMILVATGGGLIKLDAISLSELGTLPDRFYQSVVVGVR